MADCSYQTYEDTFNICPYCPFECECNTQEYDYDEDIWVCPDCEGDPVCICEWPLENEDGD